MSDVRERLETIAALEAEKGELDDTIKRLKASLLDYVEKKGDYEDDDFKVTRVQGFTRTWNPARLAAILPKGVFLKVVNYVPDAGKIDELVKAGKIDLDKIKPAFEETPKAAYPKITKKSKSDKGAEGEAESLAAKLA